MKPFPTSNPNVYNEKAPDAATPRASIFSIAPENANHEVINMSNHKVKPTNRQLNQYLDAAIQLRDAHPVLCDVQYSILRTETNPNDVNELLSFLSEVIPKIPGVINCLEGLVDES